MLGQIDPSEKTATIIGGGISGLLMAYRLDKQGFAVTLIEKSREWGGLIRTKDTPYGIVEAAAHSLLAPPAARAILTELAVPIVEARERARTVYRGGKPRRLPLRPSELAGLVWRAARAPALAAENGALPGGASSADTADTRTLEDWALTYLGKPALDYLLNPFLRGVFAARPQELLASAALPELPCPSQRSLVGELMARRRAHGPREPKLMIAPRDGMQSFVDALVARLRVRLGPRMILGEEVRAVPDAANVILAVPAGAAAEILVAEAPALAAALRSVPYAPLVSATVFARTSAFRREPRGVGVLIPEVESGRESLGILYNSSAFPGRVKDPSYSSFSVFLGGTCRPELVKWDDEPLRALIIREMQEVLGLRGSPAHIEIHRWERAIPIYGPPLVKAWNLANETWCKKSGRVIFGNYSGELSLRAMIGR